MASSLQIRILIFTKVGYLYWVWMILATSRECKWSTNSFHWSKFKAHSRDALFLWLLIFFWSILVNIFIWSLISHYINTPSKGNKWWNKNKEIWIFTCPRCWCWRILFFFNAELKVSWTDFLKLGSN